MSTLNQSFKWFEKNVFQLPTIFFILLKVFFLGLWHSMIEPWIKSAWNSLNIKKISTVKQFNKIIHALEFNVQSLFLRTRVLGFLLPAWQPNLFLPSLFLLHWSSESMTQTRNLDYQIWIQTDQVVVKISGTKFKTKNKNKRNAYELSFIRLSLL